MFVQYFGYHPTYASDTILFTLPLIATASCTWSSLSFRWTRVVKGRITTRRPSDGATLRAQTTWEENALRAFQEHGTALPWNPHQRRSTPTGDLCERRSTPRIRFDVSTASRHRSAHRKVSGVMREAGDDPRTVQDNDGKEVTFFWSSGLLVVRLCFRPWCCGLVGCLGAGCWCLVPAAVASSFVVCCLTCFPGLWPTCRLSCQEPIPSSLPGRASFRYTQVLWRYCGGIDLRAKFLFVDMLLLLSTSSVPHYLDPSSNRTVFQRRYYSSQLSFARCAKGGSTTKTKILGEPVYVGSRDLQRFEILPPRRLRTTRQPWWPIGLGRHGSRQRGASSGSHRLSRWSVYLFPKHPGEKVAKLHFPALNVKLTILAQTQADSTNVKVVGPFKSGHYRFRAARLGRRYCRSQRVQVEFLYVLFRLCCPWRLQREVPCFWHVRDSITRIFASVRARLATAVRHH